MEPTTSWGTALWDRTDAVTKFLQFSQEQTERSLTFIKELTKLEAEHAKGLRKLAQTYLPAAKKKDKEDPRSKLTLTIGFNEFVKGVNSLANTHDLISEDSNKVIMDLGKTISDFKVDYKQTTAELEKYHQNLMQGIKAMEIVKKTFEKSSADSEKALVVYQQVEGTPQNAKPGQLEKARTVSMEKQDAAQKAKQNYIRSLETANSIQKNYYKSELPMTLDKMQRMEVEHINILSSLLKETVFIHQKYHTIMNTCLEDMLRGASMLDPEGDCRQVIEVNISGLQPPSDIPFQDYLVKDLSVVRTEAKKKKKEPTTASPYPDFPDLVPMQRIKKVKKVIEDLDKNIIILSNKRDALKKLIDSVNSFRGDKNVMVVEQEAVDKDFAAVQVERNFYAELLTQLESVDHSSLSQTDSFTGIVTAGSVEENFSCESEEEFDFGTCTVMYSFPGTNPGELGVLQGDKLVVLQPDDDGWTKVAKRDGLSERVGYVPTSYIQMS